MQLDVLKAKKVDAIFVTGNTDQFEQAGMHALHIRTFADHQRTDSDFDDYDLAAEGEPRRALGQSTDHGHPLCAHAPRRNRGDSRRSTRARAGVSEHSIPRPSLNFLPKPYPDHEAVANAYKLCSLKNSPKPRSRARWRSGIYTSLRILDHSGFIDQLYR